MIVVQMVPGQLRCHLLPSWGQAGRPFGILAMWMRHCRRHRGSPRRNAGATGSQLQLGLLRFLVRRRRPVYLQTRRRRSAPRVLGPGRRQSWATRGTGRDVKSSVRLAGDESVLVAFDESQEESWITDRIRDTCKVWFPNSKIEVLGAVIGTANERDQFFEERLDKLIQLRSYLADIEDAVSILFWGNFALIFHGSPTCCESTDVM